MSGPDLRSFVGRSRAFLESEPPTTGRETRAWLVEPFLQTLGWDSHADAVAVETTVEETRLEYVLGVDSVPALFVAVDPYDRSLDESRARGLLEAMAWTGVDRAIYTNGREYLFLAGTHDVERLACRLSALPDHESSIEHFSRGALTRRLDADSEPAVARRLAVRQATLVEAFVDRLTATAGDAYADEFEAAAERFCEQLVVSFAETDAERFDSPSDDISFRFTDPTTAGSDSSSNVQSEPESASRRSRNDGLEAADDALEGEPQPQRTRAEANGERTDDTNATPSASESDDTAPPSSQGTTEDASPATDDDGEYVARFFNDRGSIGAIGHSSSRRALVGVAEYLFERGLSGVSVPWSPDDGDEEPTVLNADPIRANGEPMTAPQELSNGLYLETAGDTETHAERATALASRAGLRVLLTGDWE
ncbi:hypothetical protein [Halopiger xanaduensis]|uniref:Type I restriction enzyme R protein N-terminal domain-containing protein n=1 Tax=Halopiger xanaduensis (strain DSM 18323 / JCM 14033 / SH-6) TaxID=797210 RepID=F8DC65_HALXS|nr:hypothetical protein [Halopiger xanaduensis]AEH37178.1 hypothetical protein Halxa_2560 [Halopiger xanaduensis SH-6]